MTVDGQPGTLRTGMLVWSSQLLIRGLWVRARVPQATSFVGMVASTPSRYDKQTGRPRAVGCGGTGSPGARRVSLDVDDAEGQQRALDRHVR
jgi:hypothetical protein